MLCCACTCVKASIARSRLRSRKPSTRYLSSASHAQCRTTNPPALGASPPLVNTLQGELCKHLLHNSQTDEPTILSLTLRVVEDARPPPSPRGARSLPHFTPDRQ